MSHRRLPPPHHLAARLQCEWHRLNRRPHAIATVNGWGLALGAVSSLDEVLHRVGYGWPGDDETDANLGELVRLAATEHLAARIVLQRILPGLANVARRHGRNHPSRTAAAFDELLGCAWQLIRTYPIDRRPRWIAANLVRDANYHAFTRPARLRRHPTTPFEAMHDRAAADVAREDPLLELIEFLAAARESGADAGDVAFIARLASAPSVAAIAAELNVTDRTVRTRRAAAVERLRHVAAA